MTIEDIEEKPPQKIDEGPTRIPEETGIIPKPTPHPSPISPEGKKAQDSTSSEKLTSPSNSPNHDASPNP